jgi:hypothetical protein
MNLLTLLTLIGQAVMPLLISAGKSHQADFINDALAAVAAGKNIDDILAKAAADWKANGEPTFDEIAAARAEIQARMGE